LEIGLLTVVLYVRPPTVQSKSRLKDQLISKSALLRARSAPGYTLSSHNTGLSRCSFRHGHADASASQRSDQKWLRSTATSLSCPYGFRPRFHFVPAQRNSRGTISRDSRDAL